MTQFPLARRRLDALARAWQSRAAAFGIWNSSGPVLVWPAERATNSPDLDAPVANFAGGYRVGIVGPAGEDCRSRLAADAALVGELLKAERDLSALTDELVGQQDQLLALYELARTSRGQLDVRRLLSTVADQVRLLFAADAAFVRVDAPDPVLVVSPSGAVSSARIETYLQESLASARTLVLDTTDDSVLACPFRIGASGTGVMGVLRAADFTTADVKLLDAIAMQIASQVENALMHAEALERTKLQVEMQLAGWVQQQLLPTAVPDVRGLDLAAISRPASEVGGDFYDWLTLGGGELALAFGDVSGKGAAAAFVMSMTRTALRSAVLSSDRGGPGLATRTTNDTLYRDLAKLEMFVTLVVAQYCPAARTVSLVNNGHAGVVYRPAGGRARLLDAAEPPIGMLDIAAGIQTSVPLAPGDLLLVASDGYYESRDAAGEMYGLDRFVADVDEWGHLTSSELAKVLTDFVVLFTDGCRQHDDRTLLVLKGTDS